MHCDTFLSNSVSTLLGCANFTVVSSDYSSEYLTNRYTFNWDSIGLLLKDEADNTEPSEWTLRSKTWFLHTIKALVPVFDTAERLCQKAATSDTVVQKRLCELWKWTGNADELLMCLKELYGSSPPPTSAVESMLVTSAIIERSLGNVLRKRNLPVPFLLRDLLLERPLYDTIGEVPVQFTRLLVGMPLGLNARNLVWHGFVAPSEMTLRIPATLLILIASLGEILGPNAVPSVYDVSLPVISGTEDLPQVSSVSFNDFKSLICTGNLPVVPSQFLPFWEAAFHRYKNQQFGRCLVLLLPQLELVLRIGFCICNNCPKRLLTAVQSAPHTTLDDMLVEAIDGKPNMLCQELGDGLLNALFDFLQRPSGPRIRDRLGHGECELSSILSKLAEVLLSVSVAVAARLSKQPPSQLSFWDDYTSRFHPSILLLKTGSEVLNEVEKVNVIVQSTSALIDSENDDLNLTENLQKIFNTGDSTVCVRQSLIFEPATLFRPRQEIIATTALLRTLRSLCVALEATKSEMEKRSSEVREGRLRSRQRKTLQRMVQITPSVTKGSICLVMMAVRIRNAIAENPNNFTQWQRCISQMEIYTEKLASYTHGTKNRWEEVKMLTSSFCDSVLPFFT